jgi:hypothetical protein
MLVHGGSAALLWQPRDPDCTMALFAIDRATAGVAITALSAFDAAGELLSSRVSNDPLSATFGISRRAQRWAAVHCLHRVVAPAAAAGASAATVVQRHTTTDVALLPGSFADEAVSQRGQLGGQAVTPTSAMQRRRRSSHKAPPPNMRSFLVPAEDTATSVDTHSTAVDPSPADETVTPAAAKAAAAAAIAAAAFVADFLRAPGTAAEFVARKTADAGPPSPGLSQSMVAVDSMGGGAAGEDRWCALLGTADEAFIFDASASLSDTRYWRVMTGSRKWAQVVAPCVVTTVDGHPVPSPVDSPQQVMAKFAADEGLGGDGGAAQHGAPLRSLTSVVRWKAAAQVIVEERTLRAGEMDRPTVTSTFTWDDRKRR